MILALALMFGATVLAPVLGGICGLFASLLSTAAGIAVGVSVTLLCVALLVGRLVWLLRSAAWLEGTTLAVRGLFRTRRCDLATASAFALDTLPETVQVTTPDMTYLVPTGRRIPRLTIHDATGHRVRLKLTDPATQELLAPTALLALADAMNHHHSQTADNLGQTSAALRELAHHSSLRPR